MPILTVQERIGTRIAGRYRIERLLARGGMSVLFEARDTRTHRSVAVKLLKTEDCVDERRVARFLQETRLTAELRDLHVVDVLDLGQEETGAPYLVMELLHGRSLQAELDARGVLGIEEALATLLPVMAALAAVHSAGVIHRDIKPDNIFLHLDGTGRVIPKLLDFGIAKHPASTFGTCTGAVLGTPDYMAPEQVLGDETTAATDVWAMGAVLYRALCGETPFRSTTAAQTLAKLAHEPAPLLRVPGLPPALCAAVDRALIRQLSGRYANMTEFANAIVTCANEAGVAVPNHVHSRTVTTLATPANTDRRTRATEPTGGARSSAARDRKAVSQFGFAGLLLALGLLGATAIAAAPARHAIAKAARPAEGTTARADHEARQRDPIDAPDEPQARTPAHPADETRPVPRVGEAAETRWVTAPTAARRTAIDARRASHAARAPAKRMQLRGLPVAVEW